MTFTFHLISDVIQRGLTLSPSDLASQHLMKEEQSFFESLIDRCAQHNIGQKLTAQGARRIAADIQARLNHHLYTVLLSNDSCVVLAGKMQEVAVTTLVKFVPFS